MAATVRSFIFIATLSSVALSHFSHCHEMPGMVPWQDSAQKRLQSPPNPGAVNLLDLPEWMPSYLYRNLDLPSSPIRANILHGIADKLRATGLAVVALGSASVLKNFLLPQEMPLPGTSSLSRQSPWHLLHPAPIIGNLLSARTLLQLMTSESVLDLAQRALILSTCSQWIQHYFSTGSMTADLPAHLWQWLTIADDLRWHLSPSATGVQPVIFENGQLNQLFQISLVSPQLPRNPFINLTPLANKEGFIPATSYEKLWQALHDYCQAEGIQHLHLYPVTTFDIPYLYIRVWRNGVSGRMALAGSIRNDVSSGQGRPHWWTDNIRMKSKLKEKSGDPLSPEIIAQLPGFISTSLSNNDLSNHDLTNYDLSPHNLKLQLFYPSDTSSCDNFAAITLRGGGLLFLDWQSERTKSQLPKITLITASVPTSPVPVNQLQAIQNLQPSPEYPEVSLLSKAGYDLLWLYLATRFSQ